MKRTLFRSRTLPLALAFVSAIGCSPAATTRGGGTTGTTGTTRSAQRTVAAPDASAVLELAPAVRDDGRLPSTARPTRYALALELDPRREDYTGTITIDVEVTAETRAIVMHARDMSIEGAYAIAANATRESAPTVWSASTATRKAHAEDHEEELVLGFGEALPAGAYRVVIPFKHAYEKELRGIYRVKSGDDWYVFTQMEAVSARRGFPCFDEPGFKVPWDIQVAVPKGMVAVSNMPEDHRADGANDTTTVAFKTTPATPSYLVALGVGPFDVVEGPSDNGVPIRAITVKGRGNMTEAIRTAASQQVKILAEYFDRAYPYPKLDLMAVPEFGAGAMENPGLITFREELMLVDANSPARARRGMASVLAHELAHHWFGDLVTMKWWDDLWLNEGFATWATARVMERFDPESHAEWDEVGNRASAMNADALVSARRIRQPVTSTAEAEDAFDGITYAKGAAVLAMLEQWVGPEVFRDGVRMYLKDHAWGNASADDLFTALDTVSHKPVSGVAARFVNETGVPLVSVTANCAAGTKPTLTLTQTQWTVARSNTAASATPAPTPTTQTTHSKERTAAAAYWRVPVCALVSDGGAAQRVCTLLEGPTATMELPDGMGCPRTVFPNAGSSGYYRFAMSPLTEAFADPARLRTLDVPARMGLLENTWALVRSGQLSITRAMPLFAAYRDARERAVIDQLTTIVYAIDAVIPTGAPRPAWRTWLSTLFAPVGRELGWMPAPNESDERKLLRRDVLAVLGWLADDAGTLREAERLASQYINDPKSVPQEVATAALPMASRHATDARRDQLLGMLSRDLTASERVAVVSALGSFEAPALLRKGLDALLTPQVRMQDLGRGLYGAMYSPVRGATTRAWILEHMDALKEKLPGEMSWRLVGMVGATCDAAEFASLKAYWEPRVAEYNRAERGLRESTEHAGQCIDLRARILPELTRALSARPRR